MFSVWSKQSNDYVPVAIVSDEQAEKNVADYKREKRIRAIRRYLKERAQR
jgi:hypothetical protein